CCLSGDAALTASACSGLTTTRNAFPLGAGSGKRPKSRLGLAVAMFAVTTLVPRIIIAAPPLSKTLYAAVAVTVFGDGSKRCALWRSRRACSAWCQPGVPSNVTLPACRAELQLGYEGKTVLAASAFDRSPTLTASPPASSIGTTPWPAIRPQSARSADHVVGG